MKSVERRWRRSLAARITGVFLVMLLVVQVVSFSALRVSLVKNAHHKMPVTLEHDALLLDTLLERKAQALAVGAQLLAADSTFRDDVLATQDDVTILSAIRNHGTRIGATMTAYLNNDFGLRVTTHEHPDELAPLVAQLAAQASELHLASPAGPARGFDSRHAAVVALVGASPYQAVLVPVKAPLLKALSAAGSSGITVKELATKLKVKPGNIFSWFYTTGKKINGIKKVGEAKYAYAG